MALKMRDGDPTEVSRLINKWYDLHVNQGISYHEDHGEGLDNYQANGWLAPRQILDDFGLGTAVLMSPKTIVETVSIFKGEQPDSRHPLYIAHTDNQGKV